MKFYQIFSGIIILCILSLRLNAQIDSVIVEKYYIAGPDDTVSFDLAEPLKVNSITYRIFIDLAEGSKLLEIFGSANHPFIISGSDVFFNNTFRGESFGYRNNERSFAYNTAALDSWLTLGMVTRNHFGVLKAYDPDGSIDEIENNLDSVLKNDNSPVGIPLFKNDGLVEADSVLSITSFGVLNITTGKDSTIFGTYYKDTIFTSTEFSLRESTLEGVSGPTGDNRILIAQLTNTGNISFTLNLRVRDNNGNVYTYYGKDTLINENENERFSSWLRYPFNLIKGCMNPYYAEYNPDAVIDDGSCQDSVIFGCLDFNACNYNPEANVHLDELCCFNSACELDLEQVCEGTVYGCMDPEAANYNPDATETSDLDGCCYRQGCMDDRYIEYDGNACYQDSNDCKILIVRGCTDKSACNYNPAANRNASCDYSCHEQGTKTFTIEGSNKIGIYNLSIYPNPVDGILVCDVSLSDNANISYEILNLLGQKVLSCAQQEHSGNHHYEINLGGMEKGVYFIKVKVNNSISTKRIIKF